jgi:beta-lactamase regulating signal transducer with metallopeptidase domain
MLFSTEITEALGWTVLHSLWQSGIIAAILLLSFIALKKASAKLRYRLAGGAMLTVLLTSIVTFFYFFNIEKAKETSVIIIEENTESASPILINIPEETSSLGFFSNYFEQHLPLIVAIWLVGMGFFLLRLLGGFAYVHYLKNNKVRAITAYWQQKADALCDKIPVKKSVAILESTLVKMPMTIGYLKPVILLPVGLINHLSIEQTEAVLAHELAHIARKDYLFNILQSVMEVLFYFNPAVWLISAHIRRERENCCDDIAVRVCGNSLNYVKALVSVEEVSQKLPQLAMAFSNNKNHLLMRVQRILKQPQKKSRLGEKLIAALFILATFGLFAFQQKEVATMEVITIENGNTDLDLPVTIAEEVEEVEATKALKIKVLSSPVDTLPTVPNGRVRIKTNVNGKKMMIETKNGEIEELMVNNRVIKPEDYEKYEKEIAQLLENAENIPPPPAPPSVGDIPPPAPPTPDKVTVLQKDGTFSTREETREEMRERIEADRVKRKTEMDERMNERKEAMNKRKKELDARAEKLRQEMKELKSEADALHAVAKESRTLAVKKNDQTERVEEELKKDGLYNKGVYKFKLTNKELKINGKKQSKEMYKKYKEICESFYDGVGVDYSFEIRRTKNGNKQTISIGELKEE